MIERSYDPDILTAACLPYEYHFSPDNATWLANHDNLMYVMGEDVGLATFDYPGMYTLHWFMKSRGKDVLKVGKAMLEKLFSEHDIKVLRGVTPVENRPARFLAKRFGFKTISIEEFLDGPNELMLLTKEDFNQIKDKL